MIHIFLDASVLLAFSRSSHGGSAYILRCCEQGTLKGYVSKKVVFEARKNATEDMGEQAVKAIDYVFTHSFLTVVPDGTDEELEKAKRTFDNPKDAPIIASAKQIPGLTHILSLDNGFFIPEVVAYAQPIEIIKPGAFIQQFRSQLEK